MKTEPLCEVTSSEPRPRRTHCKCRHGGLRPVFLAQDTSSPPPCTRNSPPCPKNFPRSGSMAFTTPFCGELAIATSLSKSTGRFLGSQFGSLNTKYRKKSSASPNGVSSVKRYHVSSLPGYGGGKICCP